MLYWQITFVAIKLLFLIETLLSRHQLRNTAQIYNDKSVTMAKVDGTRYRHNLEGVEIQTVTSSWQSTQGFNEEMLIPRNLSASFESVENVPRFFKFSSVHTMLLSNMPCRVPLFRICGQNLPFLSEREACASLVCMQILWEKSKGRRKTESAQLIQFPR